MRESSVLIQHVVQQRTQAPTGFRIWSDGKVQHCANNALPDPFERLDMDRELRWDDQAQLEQAHLATIREAIRASGIFEMEPRLLINYCKDDPGAAIWSVNLDGQTARVVVYDPKPKRSAELDSLMQTIKLVLPN